MKASGSRWILVNADVPGLTAGGAEPFVVSAPMNDRFQDISSYVCSWPKAALRLRRLPTLTSPSIFSTADFQLISASLLNVSSWPTTEARFHPCPLSRGTTRARFYRLSWAGARGFGDARRSRMLLTIPAFLDERENRCLG